ncbi:MAG: hypothetical protein N3F64_01325 [Nitrososphaeria archaeon]|nr:hypothetical protein [Nitrososphaeria archaeon]
MFNSIPKHKCVMCLINKVDTTKVMERGIYHNYPIMTFYEPSSLIELEHIVRLGRKIAEVKLKRRREPIAEVLKFFIEKISRREGSRKSDFSTLYPEIGVNKKGEIEYMVAPNKNINPLAYSVYLEYHLNKYIKTRDQKHLMRVIGVPVYEGRPEPIIKRSWPKWQDKDITDLIAEDISWLFGPPKKEKSPLEF